MHGARPPSTIESAVLIHSSLYIHQRNDNRPTAGHPLTALFFGKIVVLVYRRELSFEEMDAGKLIPRGFPANNSENNSAPPQKHRRHSSIIVHAATSSKASFCDVSKTPIEASQEKWPLSHAQSEGTD